MGRSGSKFEMSGDFQFDPTLTSTTIRLRPVRFDEFENCMRLHAIR